MNRKTANNNRTVYRLHQRAERACVARNISARSLHGASRRHQARCWVPAHRLRARREGGRAKAMAAKKRMKWKMACIIENEEWRPEKWKKWEMRKKLKKLTNQKKAKWQWKEEKKKKEWKYAWTLNMKKNNDNDVYIITTWNSLEQTII